MKKLLSLLVVALLAFSAMPLIMADGDDVPIGGGVIVNPPADTCYDPEIYVDHTARGWFPNDQTFYTAEEYGNLDPDGKYNCNAAGNDYDRYAVEERMNYVFEGETVDYYIMVRDLNGVEDLDTIQLIVEDGSIPTAVGACAPVDQADCGVAFQAAAFGVTAFNWSTDQVYVCKLIVPDAANTWAKGEKEVRIKVVDGALDNSCIAKNDITEEADLTFFNPTLSLEITQGSMVNFGTVTPGTIATSNSIYLGNVVPSVNEQSGVVMDIYLASDDYFTDPTNGNAICPTGNGIKYDRFSYYATKGSLNSGANNNAFPGLGETEGCVARADEFTVLPSHSGHIEDMCRVINWRPGASLLTQGSEMSVTFRLDVPNPCSGNFNNGQFHFVGRVV